MILCSVYYVMPLIMHSYFYTTVAKILMNALLDSMTAVCMPRATMYLVVLSVPVMQSL